MMQSHLHLFCNFYERNTVISIWIRQYTVFTYRMCEKRTKPTTERWRQHKRHFSSISCGGHERHPVWCRAGWAQEQNSPDESSRKRSISSGGSFDHPCHPVEHGKMRCLYKIRAKYAKVKGSVKCYLADSSNTRHHKLVVEVVLHSVLTEEHVDLVIVTLRIVLAFWDHIHVDEVRLLSGQKNVSFTLFRAVMILRCIYN